MKKKIYPLSSISSRGKNHKIDSVAEAEQQELNKSNLTVLRRASHAYDSLRKFREARDRAKKYTFGDQWSDVVKTEFGEMTEEEYIVRQGSVPLKNNLIRRLVGTLVGVYRGQGKEPMAYARDSDEQLAAETMTMALQYNMQLNKFSELNARGFEEFLISGLVVQKETYGWRDHKMECWTDNISPNHFFFDSNIRDIRGFDCNIVGQIHDMSYGDLLNHFAKDKKMMETLGNEYSLQKNRRTVTEWRETLKGDDLKNVDFFVPIDPKMCRVIEVWTKEFKERLRCHDYLKGEYYVAELSDLSAIEQENESRIQQGLSEGMDVNDIPLIDFQWFVDTYWYFRYMTPIGTVLKEGETPFHHKCSPYVFKAYPLIDGEVHSFVEDVIDQQRYINRLITLNDWIIKASAKGVLMIDEGSIPEDMTPEDFADEWTKSNGVIVYKAKPGVAPPQQIATNSTNVGVNQMLEMQIKLLNDVSGVQGALQGKQGYSGMSANLYAQQVENSSNSISDILESYSSFEKDVATKKMKNIRQFYTDKKVVNIAGKRSSAMQIYDPNQIKNAEFDIAISEGISTPIAKMAANDLLLQIFQMQGIDVEQLLEFGSFPFSEGLLQSIKQKREEMQEQGVEAPLPQ